MNATAAGRADHVRTARGDERGTGSSPVAAIIVVVCGAAFWTLVLAGWITSAQHARQVADLAALAGAHAHKQGEQACQAAGEYARRNGGELADCSVSTGTGEYVIHVEVAVDLRPALPGAPSAVREKAHAGFLIPDEEPGIGENGRDASGAGGP